MAEPQIKPPPGFKLEGQGKDGVKPPPGFKLESVDSTSTSTSDKPSQIGEFFGTLGSDIAAIPGAAWQAVTHPIDTIKGISQSQGAELEASKAAFKKGQYGEGIRRGIGYMLPVVGPALSQAGTEMQRGEYGKGLAHTAELTPLPEMAVKGVAGLGGRLMRGGARSVYEAELRPTSKLSLAQRKEIVGKGLEKRLPIEAKSIDTLQESITANKATIESLTKDPTSAYSIRTMPTSDLLDPVNKFIARVARVDKAQAKALMSRRNQWINSLGGKDATVAQAQQLKEDLYAVINSGAYADTAEPGTMVAGRKLAARGIKTGIEQAIPEEPIRAINHAIETDIRLKDSITRAIKTHPSWINDWAVFVLGAGAGELAGGHLGGGAAAIGALTRMAARNPRIMSRLAIALDQGAGMHITPLLTGARATEIGTRPQRDKEDNAQ